MADVLTDDQSAAAAVDADLNLNVPPVSVSDVTPIRTLQASQLLVYLAILVVLYVVVQFITCTVSSLMYDRRRLRNYMAVYGRFSYHDASDLSGKTVIVTGADENSIGYWTAVDLSKRGARVIITCYYLSDAFTAAGNIEAQTGNSDISFKELRLDELTSVRDFAADIVKRESRLDVLISCEYFRDMWTEPDGMRAYISNFLCLFQANYLGTFLLSMLLMDKLEESGAGKIVLNISTNDFQFDSYVAQLNIDQLDFDNGYDLQQVFAKSTLIFGQRKDMQTALGDELFLMKFPCTAANLALVLFAHHMKTHLEGREGVTVNVIDPGYVYNIDPLAALIFRDSHRTMLKACAHKILFLTYCARFAGVSGVYLNGFCQQVALRSSVLNDETARRLFRISERLVGLEDPDMKLLYDVVNRPAKDTAKAKTRVYTLI